MKKFMTSGAVALVLSSGVMAEESGAFVGLDLGIGNSVMTLWVGISGFLARILD